MRIALSRKRLPRFALVFAALWLAAAYFFAPHHSAATPLPAASTTAAATTTPSFYPVVHIVDGDTIDVKEGAQKVRVRLIGIDTPEVVDPKKPVQCYGPEASAEMKRIATGQSVRLETDPTQDLHDKYGRLLAYVFLPDGTDANLHMIEAGFAREYTYKTPYEYQAQFKAAEADARAAGRGLWSACPR